MIYFFILYFKCIDSKLNSIVWNHWKIATFNHLLSKGRTNERADTLLASNKLFLEVISLKKEISEVQRRIFYLCRNGFFLLFFDNFDVFPVFLFPLVFMLSFLFNSQFVVYILFEFLFFYYYYYYHFIQHLKGKVTFETSEVFLM